MKVIATSKGYFGSVIREIGDAFEVPDELWDDEARRPQWARIAGAVDAAPAVEVGGKGDGKSSPPAGDVVVPADWSSLHHSKRKALAKAISGAAVADLGEADTIIAAYVEANKPAPFGDAPAPQTVKEAQKAIGGMQPDWVAPGSDTPKAVAD